MADRLGSEAGETIADTVQNLVLSTVRLSAALTLYGLEQLQTVTRVSAGNRGLATVAEELGTALDSVADPFVKGINETKRDALISVTAAARFLIRKSFQIVSPGVVLEALNDLLNKAAQPLTVFNGTKKITKNAPELAVDVLSGTSNQHDAAGEHESFAG